MAKEHTQHSGLNILAIFKWDAERVKAQWFIQIEMCILALGKMICIVIIDNIHSIKGKIQYNTIQYNTIQYNTIQYNTIQYNTIQYNTIQYNTIQYNTQTRYENTTQIDSLS